LGKRTSDTLSSSPMTRDEAIKSAQQALDACGELVPAMQKFRRKLVGAGFTTDEIAHIMGVVILQIMTPRCD